MVRDEMKHAIFILVFWGAIMTTGVSAETRTFDYTKLNSQAVQESLQAIRPGQPEKAPFWNTYAERFMYAPAFEFSEVRNAKRYRFRANGKYEFVASHPWSPLTPIWRDIPIGPVQLVVEAVDEMGNVIGLAGERQFYRAAPFTGPYRAAVRDYRESALHGLDYIFTRSFVQSWKEQKTPDTSYVLYCYPSKMIGGLIRAMMRYVENCDTRREDALQIAENAAHYLLEISQPSGTPLAYFPPTYIGDKLAARTNTDQVMFQEPTKVAMAYLDMYQVTRKSKYLIAATQIADTYVKTQLPSGTWPMKANIRSGEATTEILCVPTEIIWFFDRLANEFNRKEYDECCNHAVKWIMNNPVETFDWTGQFEDIDPADPYQNQTGLNAVLFAIYLLRRKAQDPKAVDLVKELLQFAEDQFVVWEKPMPQKGVSTEYWMTPCVLEQYRCYVPIDTSAGIMILGYLRAFEVTRDEMFLAKAIALANLMTAAQDQKTGRFMTEWNTSRRKWVKHWWLNCARFDAKVLLEFSTFLEKPQQDSSR